MARNSQVTLKKKIVEETVAENCYYKNPDGDSHFIIVAEFHIKHIEVR